MRKLISIIKKYYAIYRGGEIYLNYLRKLGVRIGRNCKITDIRTINIDITRPYLVEIGDNVRLNRGLTILTHDYVSRAFKIIYGDFLPSSGKVKIGNNVYFGRNCSVLKGVTIGDNTIIGYGSIVTKDIPSNSVAVGVPARVICTLDEYYEKRKAVAYKEAIDLVNELELALNRKAKIEDMKEEFIYFVSGNEVEKYPKLNIKRQLTYNGNCYDKWRKNHIAKFKNFEDFVKYARAHKEN